MVDNSYILEDADTGSMSSFQAFMIMMERILRHILQGAQLSYEEYNSLKHETDLLSNSYAIMADQICRDFDLRKKSIIQKFGSNSKEADDLADEKQEEIEKITDDFLKEVDLLSIKYSHKKNKVNSLEKDLGKPYHDMSPFNLKEIDDVLNTKIGGVSAKIVKLRFGIGDETQSKKVKFFSGTKTHVSMVDQVRCLTLEEIAQHLNIPIDVVIDEMYSALQILRKELPHLDFDDFSGLETSKKNEGVLHEGAFKKASLWFSGVVAKNGGQKSLHNRWSIGMQYLRRHLKSQQMKALELEFDKKYGKNYNASDMVFWVEGKVRGLENKKNESLELSEGVWALLQNSWNLGKFIIYKNKYHNDLDFIRKNGTQNEVDLAEKLDIEMYDFVYNQDMKKTKWAGLTSETDANLIKNKLMPLFNRNLNTFAKIRTDIETGEKVGKNKNESRLQGIYNILHESDGISLTEATGIIRSFAKRSGKSEAEVERLWQEARKQAEKQGHKPSDGNTYYRYVVGILKHMLKLTPQAKETANA